MACGRLNPFEGQFENQLWFDDSYGPDLLERVCPHEGIHFTDFRVRFKAQIAGVAGEDLTGQPKLAEKVSQACRALKSDVLDGWGQRPLTERLKRKIRLRCLIEQVAPVRDSC